MSQYFLRHQREAGGYSGVDETFIFVDKDKLLKFVRETVFENIDEIFGYGCSLTLEDKNYSESDPEDEDQEETDHEDEDQGLDLLAGSSIEFLDKFGHVIFSKKCQDEEMDLCNEEQINDMLARYNLDRPEKLDNASEFIDEMFDEFVVATQGELDFVQEESTQNWIATNFQNIEIYSVRICFNFPDIPDLKLPMGTPVIPESLELNWS
jgi:hypothetical protein